MSFDKMSSDKKIKKPFIKIEATPEPHFMPGYTGFCPGLQQGVGISYARMTNKILENRPEIAGRLNPVEPNKAAPEKTHKVSLGEMDKDKKLIKSWFPSEDRRAFNDYMLPGYSGHVPNISDAIGLSYAKGCVKSIAKFIRQQDEDTKESTSIM